MTIERPQPPGREAKKDEESLRDEVRALQQRVLEVRRTLSNLKREFEHLKQERG